MKTLMLFIAAACLAGCATNPSLTKMGGAGYRANNCYGDNKMVCSRMMRQTCPEGIVIMNPSTAETKGPIFICSSTE